ncbi:MAG: aminotransferase class V-fold PLP-dependent enzyme [Candidatus Pacebacteria bacterium]|nr:aminotransferase class V-fold PLP-dependent enzyme [Candidatus Paceibacterota bacterium]
MKTVSISLSPNTEKDDVLLSFKELFSFSKKEGKAIKEFEDNFKKHFGFNSVFSLNSGRSSLLVILEALDIEEGDEIIVQAFTCNAVINPIIQKKAKPVYVDIDDTLNMDAFKIEEKISKRTKAIIIQHTFGMPANIKTIKEILDKHHLILIEDCAHALGAKYNNKYCGTFGDVSFFSFGRDKVISSVYGGMIAVNNASFKDKIKRKYSKLSYPKTSWINQQLMHPIIMNLFVLPLYNFLNIGKAILALSIKLKILSKAVSKGEYEGYLPEYFPKKLPNSLAKLANNQFNKLNRFNSHRREVSKYYKENIGGLFRINDDAVYMKYPILVNNSDEIVNEFAKFNIILEDGWRKKVIAPPKTNLCRMNYEKGECPKAEEISNRILILPTHINITKDIAEKIIYLFESFNDKGSLE